ncbi:MAG: UDP-N-acetylglucosamine 1-carboxyvinyltransferase [Thermoactinomyces sp.]
MEQFVIEGGKPLSGSVRVQGAKNATLPIIAATVLTEGVHKIENVPDLTDIRAMCQILEVLGAEIVFQQSVLWIDTTRIRRHLIPEYLMKQIRSSVFLMGPLLARLHKVSVTKPGGCNIGKRPIDLHLKGLAQLGTEIREAGEMIYCETSQLRGNHIRLDFPSVGATENILMAAVLARGTTIIQNAAREPEIVDLARFLCKMGAQIEGAGTSTVKITGVERLTAASHRIMPDRIVAGSLAIAAAVTGGEIVLEEIGYDQIAGVACHLEPMGLQFGIVPGGIKTGCPSGIQPVQHLVTEPFPGFPTDLQPQTIVLLALADGISRLTENIFESRLKHVAELKKMGADLELDGNTVRICGVSHLRGATVYASDLRAGAALIIAGLAATGRTVVYGANHIDRGYESLEKVFRQLGANINRRRMEKQ